MNAKELGTKILLAREELNMSQEELAQAIGCSQSALSNYEKGKRHIYLKQLERLSTVLNKPLDYFVSGAGGEKQKTDQESFENKIEKINEHGQEHNKRFISLMNDIYELSDDHFYQLSAFVQFLQWKQKKGD